MPPGGDPASGAAYPKSMDSGARRALFDNLDRGEWKALAVDEAVRQVEQDNWGNNAMKVKKVRNAIAGGFGEGAKADEILQILTNQNEY